MFIDDVNRNIINTDKLKQADDIIDKRIRNLIKNKLRDIRGSERLNRPKVVLNILNQIGRAIGATYSVMDEERDKIFDDLKKTSKDPYIILKEQMKDVSYIVDCIKRDDLIAFYKTCMDMGSEFAVPEGMSKIRRPTGTFDIIEITEKDGNKEHQENKVYIYSAAKKEKEEKEKNENDQ